MFRRAPRVPPAIAGAVLFALLVASIAFAFVSHKGLPGRSYTYATAAFADLSAGLRPGSDVRVKGVRVGQVHKTFYEGGEARAELQLPGELHVYRDATARIRSRSALGQRYVDIDPGTPPAGRLGADVLPQSRTASLVELDQVLDALDPTARAGFAGGLRELGAGLGGRGGDLNDLIALAPDLLSDLGTTTNALASDDANLVGLLTAAERLAGRFSGREGEISSLLAQSARTLAAIDADGGSPLHSTLGKAPGALDGLTSGLGALTPAAAQAAAAISALRPAAAALGAATPELRGALREGVGPLTAVPPVSGLTTPAFEGLTGVARDARPFVPEFATALATLRGPLELLVPYSPELNALFANLRDSFSGGDARGKWLRTISIVIGADNYSGDLPATNPFINRNPYPAPGQAATDGERFNPAGSRP